MTKPSFFFIYFILFFNATNVSGFTVDGLAAKIGERLITISAVTTEARITAILKQRTSSVSLPVKADFSRETLDKMINRELLYRESRRLDSFQPAPDVEEEMALFESKFKNRKEFATFLEMEGMTRTELAGRFIAEKSGAAYVFKRLELMATVSIREVEDYYKKNIHQMAGEQLPAVEARIRKTLFEKKSLQILDQWIKDLRNRGEITYFARPPM